MPEPDEFHGARRCATLAEGLAGADVVMALRIQRERMTEARIPDAETYHRAVRHHGAEPRRGRGRARIVMHPGPMNRGVEISGDVADGPQSAIQQQVTNGVAVRMAVLATIARRARHETPARSGRSTG